MVEEQATVTQVSEEAVIVTSLVKSACHQCQQSESCGSGIVAKAIPHKSMTLSLPKSHVAPHLSVAVGDEVVIALPEKALLASAFEVYFYPLIGLIAFGFLGQWALEQAIISHELMALVIALAGGFTGFKLAGWRQKRKLACDRDQLEPQIVKILSKSKAKSKPKSEAKPELKSEVKIVNLDD